MSVIPQEREPEATTDATTVRQAVHRAPPSHRAPPAPRRADWNGGGSWGALGLIVLLHGIALWGLTQIESVREAVQQAAPIMVGLVTLAPPEPPKPEPPPPPRPRQIKPKPQPQMIAAQTPAPAPMAAPLPDPVIVEEPPPPPPSEPEPEPAPPVTAPNFIAAYLDNPAPRYPESSRRLGESGTVMLRVQVNVQGRPDSVEVHKSCGYARLDRAAVEAVRKWKFVPAKQGDVPIEAFVLVPLKFEL